MSTIIKIQNGLREKTLFEREKRGRNGPKNSTQRSQSLKHRVRREDGDVKSPLQESGEKEWRRPDRVGINAVAATRRVRSS